HGEIARYSAGCRCGECRMANAAYQRDYRKGIRRTRKRWKSVPEHGTEARHKGRPGYTDPCRCTECVTAVRLIQQRRRHGMTVAQYEKLLAVQGGGCGLCGMSTPQAGRTCFDVDHSHACPHAPGRSCS